MERQKEDMTNKQLGDVERNKAASNLCSRLFPAWCKPPTQGELQNLIIKSWKLDLNDNNRITQIGNWWLWFRGLVIQNTFTKQAKNKVLDIAVSTALGSDPIHFVTARSPELLHAQVKGGDKSLPRSRASIEKLKKIIDSSSSFLPTTATVVFADLAIDNLPEIEKVCDVNHTIEKNIELLTMICRNAGLENINILRMSSLTGPRGKLGDLIKKDGTPMVQLELDDRAKTAIGIATKESSESQERMFNWGLEQVRMHNKNLGITMGLVGEAVKRFSPSTLLIHNEAFIARGQLNNIFNPVNDMLPVICLSDLLESKIHKE
jgi:hypothetical protein